MLKRLTICLALATMVMAGSAGTAFAQGPVRLTLTAGPVGGDWYPAGGAIAEIIKQSIPGSQVTVTTGGGIGNVPKVDTKLADIGLTQSMLYNAALKSEAPYDKKHENIRGLGYLTFLHQAFFLVKEGSPINSMDQLIREKYPLKLVLSTKASTPELAARRLLAEYGITYADIESWGGKVYFVSFAEAQTLIADGHANSFIGPILGAITQMITMNKMKLLPWKDSALDAMVQKYAYLKKPIARNRYYFIGENMNTLAEANVLIVRKDLPDALVYNVAKAVCEHPDLLRESAGTFKNFNPGDIAKDVGGPLHPGAEKYYKEKGYLQ